MNSAYLFPTKPHGSSLLALKCWDSLQSDGTGRMAPSCDDAAGRVIDLPHQCRSWKNACKFALSGQFCVPDVCGRRTVQLRIQAGSCGVITYWCHRNFDTDSDTGMEIH